VRVKDHKYIINNKGAHGKAQKHRKLRDVCRVGVAVAVAAAAAAAVVVVVLVLVLVVCFTRPHVSCILIARSWTVSFTPLTY